MCELAGDEMRLEYEKGTAKVWELQEANAGETYWYVARTAAAAVAAHEEYWRTTTGLEWLDFGDEAENQDAALMISLLPPGEEFEIADGDAGPPAPGVFPDYWVRSENTPGDGRTSATCAEWSHYFDREGAYLLGSTEEA